MAFAIGSIKKIMIFGLPGSGKSTFAVKLGDRLHLPVYHLDKYFFIENWQERNHDEFLHILEKLVALDAWIIDGNSTRSLETRFSKADAVLYFRFNRLLCLWRICKRLFSNNSHISDRAEGCPQRVRLALIRYLWGFEKRLARTIQGFRKKYPKVAFFELRNDSQANDFISNFQ